MKFATTAEINSLTVTPRTILSSGRTSGVKSGDCGLKIKYLGKLDKIIKQFKSKKINLKLIKDKWNIKII